MFSTVDLWAVVGNFLFAASCVPLVSRVWRSKSVDGLSGWAVACWLMGFGCLLVYFTIRFDMIFFVYELYGLVMMAVVAAGWLKFRDKAVGETAHASKRMMVEERLKAIGVGNYGTLFGPGMLFGMSG
ncbi:MAG: hypothetical protein V3U77_01635 [bacterium]